MPTKKQPQRRTDRGPVDIYFRATPEQAPLLWEKKDELEQTMGRRASWQQVLSWLLVSVLGTHRSDSDSRSKKDAKYGK
jgi:hypothetical protein